MSPVHSYRTFTSGTFGSSLNRVKIYVQYRVCTNLFRTTVIQIFLCLKACPSPIATLDRISGTYHGLIGLKTYGSCLNNVHYKSIALINTN